MCRMVVSVKELEAFTGGDGGSGAGVDFCASVAVARHLNELITRG